MDYLGEMAKEELLQVVYSMYHLVEALEASPECQRHYLVAVEAQQVREQVDPPEWTVTQVAVVLVQPEVAEPFGLVQAYHQKPEQRMC